MVKVELYINSVGVNQNGAVVLDSKRWGNGS